MHDTYTVGQTLGTHPHGHRLTTYLDDGKWFTVLYAHGGFVRPHPDGGWTVPGFDGQSGDKLTRRELAELQEIAPTAGMPPLWHGQRGLVQDDANRGVNGNSGPARFRVVPNQPDEPEELFGESWRDRDLRSVVEGVVDGTIERPQPTIGILADGTALFYRSMVNGVHGSAGEGKTMLIQTIVCQELAAGHHVGFIDLEADAPSAIGRLLDLGATPQQIIERFHYIRPDEPFSADGAAHVHRLIALHDLTLLAIDSTGEAMSLNGVKDIDAEVTAWFRRVPRPLADLGPAVVVIDHVVKNRESRGLDPIGSQRKKAAISGSSYIIDAVKSMAKGKVGTAKLTVAKDRHGYRAVGTVAAMFTIDSTDDTMTATLEPPTSNVDATGRFRPTTLMEKVSRWVELNPGSTKTAIDEAHLGRAEYVRQATTMLVEDGHIRVDPQGQAQLHHVTRPYRTDEDQDHTE